MRPAHRHYGLGWDLSGRSAVAERRYSPRPPASDIWLQHSRIDQQINCGEGQMQLLLHYGDLSDSTNLTQFMGKSRPDEVYNLAAQSHVRPCRIHGSTHPGSRQQSHVIIHAKSDAWQFFPGRSGTTEPRELVLLTTRRKRNIYALNKLRRHPGFRATFPLGNGMNGGNKIL